MKANAALSVIFQAVTTALLFLFYKQIIESLGAACYGYIALIFSAASLAKVCDLSLMTSLVRDTNASGRVVAFDEAMLRRFVGAWLTTTVALLVVGNALAVVAINYLPRPLQWNGVQQSSSLICASTMLQFVSLNSRSIWDMISLSWVRNALSATQILVTWLLFHALKDYSNSIAIAQASGALVGLVACAILVMSRPEARLLSGSIRPEFGEKIWVLIPFGVKYQASGLLSAGAEAMSRLAFSWVGEFGGLALYDIANKMFVQIRIVFFTIGEASLPYLTSERASSRAFMVLRKFASDVAPVIILGTPFVAIVCHYVVAVEVNHRMMNILVVMALATSINSIASTVYFGNIAENRQLVNITTHIIMLLALGLQLALAVVFGWPILLYYAMSGGLIAGNLYLLSRASEQASAMQGHSLWSDLIICLMFAVAMLAVTAVTSNIILLSMFVILGLIAMQILRPSFAYRALLYNGFRRAGIK